MREASVAAADAAQNDDRRGDLERMEKFLSALPEWL